MRSHIPLTEIRLEHHDHGFFRTVGSAIYIEICQTPIRRLPARSPHSPALPVRRSVHTNLSKQPYACVLFYNVIVYLSNDND